MVAWNEFLFALILTQTEAAMTLPVGIASRVTQYEIKWGAMSAAGVVAMLPVLVFAIGRAKISGARTIAGGGERARCRSNSIASPSDSARAKW